MSAAAAVENYLISKATQGDGETWQEIEDLYRRKLWHQLTQKMLAYVQKAPAGLLEVYENFIKAFQDKINVISLVEILLAVSKQFSDAEQAIEFLNGFKTKVENDSLATVYLVSSLAELSLQKGDMDQTKLLLEQCGALLDEEESVTAMHATYYRVSADYHKTKGDFKGFYTDALRYLGCITEDLPLEEQAQRAFDLSLAGLLADGIYNFGELLAHKVLDVLRDTDKQWLVDLLAAFNSGDIAKFEDLKPQWSTQEDLRASEKLLHRKIKLLALMELVFTSPADQRELSFDAIAAAAKIQNDEVEWLVMKGLSLGLVKGSIDEVAKKANLHWVQPRVLNLQQIAGMRAKLDVWCKSVNETAAMVQAHTPELFVE